VGTAFQQLRVYDIRVQRRPVKEIEKLSEYGISALTVRRAQPRLAGAFVIRLLVFR
jgi:hypothetical protein